jgi:hypothetical protein
MVEVGNHTGSYHAMTQMVLLNSANLMIQSQKNLEQRYWLQTDHKYHYIQPKYLSLKPSRHSGIYLPGLLRMLHQQCDGVPLSFISEVFKMFDGCILNVSGNLTISSRLDIWKIKSSIGAVILITNKIGHRFAPADGGQENRIVEEYWGIWDENNVAFFQWYSCAT